MKNMYLLRHAPTEASIQGLASGRLSLDIPIVGDISLESALSDIPLRSFDLVAASEFRRTQETASRLRLTASRFVVTESLNEPDYGDFDRRPWLEYGNWAQENGLSSTAPGARLSWMEQLTKAVNWLYHEVAEPGHSALIVCHGYFWAACEKFSNQRIVPRIDNIYSPPYLTPLKLTVDDVWDFKTALESTAADG